ncbi:type 1 fimbrial protein [Enterobacter hormaechei]|nr:type 1 fimbrial protein [Enterobacter hormaechei]
MIRLIGFGALLSCWGGGSVLAADSQTITFNITVPAVTCTVAPQDVTVSTAISGLTFVGKNWQTGGESNLNVVLSNCSGSGAVGKSPKLTIAPSGTTTVLAGSSNFLFRDSTSTSKGFGVAIFNKPAGSITKNATTNMVANGGAAWTGTAGAAGSSLNQTIGLSTGIACGPTASCAATSLAPGNLKASITFNLVYN